VGIDETAERTGVDAMRLFLYKATPPEDTMEWTDEGIAGRVRFLDRVWRACEPFFDAARGATTDTLPDVGGPLQREVVRGVHAALKSGSDETFTRRFHYNTTLARLDELVNAMTRLAQSADAASDPALLYAVKALPIVLAPFAPHIAEELWHRLGCTQSVHLERWLAFDPRALAVDRIELVVQVNGKIRARLSTPPGLAEDEAFALAAADPNVSAYMAGKEIRKRIYVQDKLVNFVAG
jgi:leucyl-tRNA synthetase